MTERMEPAELNRRLAGLLGVELGARTEEDFETVSVHFWRNCDESMVRLIIGFPEPLEELFRRREGRVWQDAIEAFAETWERDLVDYAGDLQTAFGLGDICSERYCWAAFLRELSQIILEDGEDVNQSQLEFGLAHASAYDRALAAFRAMGGDSKTEDAVIDPCRVDEASCHADRDGECSWSKCPNLLPNGERNPDAPHCVLDVDEEE